MANEEHRTDIAQQSTIIKWPWWKKFLIGSGEFGENMSFSMFASFISIFYTDVAGISTVVVTVILWISKIWDALNDVVVGILADRTRTRLGRYRPWILASAVPLVIVTTMCFITNLNWSMGTRILYAVVTYCVYTWVFTMFYIPYVSMQGTLTQDPNERASIGSMRLTLAVLASWIVGSFGPSMTAHFNEVMGPGLSYAIPALIFVGIGCPFILISGLVAKEYVRPVGYDETLKVKQKRKKQKPGVVLKDMFSAVKANKYLPLVAIGILVASVFMNGRNTAIMYYFTYRMENLALIPLFITVLRFPMMAGMFCTQYLVRWTGSKGKVAALSNLICGIMCIVVSFTDSMPSLILFFVLSSILHFFMGMSNAAGNILVTDTVEYTEYKTGKRMDGVITSFVSFFNKVGIAVGTSLVPLVLAITGYVPNVAQSSQVITGIMACMYYVPAVLAFIAGVAFLSYKLNNKQVEEIVSILQERRAKVANTEEEN